MCELTVTKYGNPVFDFMTEIDFGNSFTQGISISNINSSNQTFIAKYKYQYDLPGDYNVYFSIPYRNYQKFVTTVPIIGYLFLRLNYIFKLLTFD